MPTPSLSRRLRAARRQVIASGQLGRFLFEHPDAARELALGAIRGVAGPLTPLLGAPRPGPGGAVDRTGADAMGVEQPPEGLDAYPRTFTVRADVSVPPARVRRTVHDLSRFPAWLTLHAGWRGAPPSGAAVGVEFTEQVRLMGIPADLGWRVDAVDEHGLALSGRGPMNLTLGLWLTLTPTAAGTRVRLDAGVGGDPVQGPMGATVVSSVKEALGDSLNRLADLLADEAGDDPGLDGAGPDGPSGGRASRTPVRHEATGRMLDPTTPVIVGVGQVACRTPDLAELVDPATLAVRALREAASDSGAPDDGQALLAGADHVYAVASASWSYRDSAALVAAALGADPAATVMSARYGGDAGQVLLNLAGQSIVDGDADVVLVCGAEAGNTLAAAQKAGLDVGWPVQDPSVRADRVVGSEREANNEAETAAGLSVPVYMYALMESALRRRSGATPAEHLRRISGLWSRLSEVAVGNPHAWQPRSVTAEELAAATEENRAVAAPYNKLLCANLQVDLASGIILTSVAAAQAAGVPQDRWVFLHAGAEAYDEWFVSERADLAASPAIRTLGEVASAHAGVPLSEIAHVDLYSCFPAAVQIAAAELGLPLDDPERPLSVTGGLTFAGGPGNNYGAHAVATLVGRLRQDPTGYGLSTSLGWFVTKHALGIYSATPPERPYRSLRPVLEPGPARPAPVGRTGPGVVEAATVAYDRAGDAEAAVLSVIAEDGARVLVRSVQPEVVEAVVEDDPLGWRVTVTGPDTVVVDERTRADLPEPPPMTVLHERRDQILVVTLNRPERRNAVDLATAELLERTVDWFEAEPDLRVAVITGAGQSFCAGADLRAVSSGEFPMTERGGPLGITARPVSKPMIAAVEGHALAGGCELALVSDLVVASTSSQFGLPEPKRGLVAVAGGVLRLAQRLPRNVAMEMVLTGNPQPATRMAELGLVNRLAEPGQVLTAALEFAEEILANAPLSVAASKRIVEESPDWPVAEAFARQSEVGMTAILSEDAAEGTLAFVEKRAPVWQGR